MIEEEKRLPKQFGHWARRARFSFVRFGKHQFPDNFYGKSKLRAYRKKPEETRRLRALTHKGWMQICDGNFDRWANSSGAKCRLPATQAEFDRCLAFLFKMSAQRWLQVSHDEVRENLGMVEPEHVKQVLDYPLILMSGDIWLDIEKVFEFCETTFGKDVLVLETGDGDKRPMWDFVCFKREADMVIFAMWAQGQER